MRTSRLPKETDNKFLCRDHGGKIDFCAHIAYALMESFEILGLRIRGWWDI